MTVDMRMLCERPPAAFGGSPTEGENRKRGGRSHTIMTKVLQNGDD
jgi:hypothetical protein